ncbi:hypothetical protein QQ045_032419 [Rhodiola kirilowii]
MRCIAVDSISVDGALSPPLNRRSNPPSPFTFRYSLPYRPVTIYLIAYTHFFLPVQPLQFPHSPRSRSSCFQEESKHSDELEVERRSREMSDHRLRNERRHWRHSRNKP